MDTYRLQEAAFSAEVNGKGYNDIGSLEEYEAYVDKYLELYGA
jgi:hypothetical protein